MKKRESDARERIISAATELIVEQGGADSLTMRDIAARAGVGVGLANYHFQTKENLVNLCAQRFEDGFWGGLGVPEPDEEPITTLKAAAREYLRFLSVNPGMARAALLNALSSPAASDGINRALDFFLAAIRGVCAGKATETEMKLLDHMLLSSLQAAFLRGNAFSGFGGMDARDEKNCGPLADVTVYILFHKYL